MNWTGLLLAVIGAGAIVGCALLIRHRVAYYESTLRQQEQMFGSWIRRANRGGSPNIFIFVGIWGMGIGTVFVTMGVLTLLGIVHPTS